MPLDQKESHGFVLYYDGGEIVAVSMDDYMLRLGDTVVANGRIFVPRGTEGKIVKIHEPYSSIFTSNIFTVDFGSEPESLELDMKFKDLSLDLSRPLRRRTKRTDPSWEEILG